MDKVSAAQFTRRRSLHVLRQASTGTLGVALGMTLGACARAAAPPAASATGTLTIFYDLTGADQPIFTAIYDAFAQTRPGRKIENVSVPFSEYAEKVTVSVAGGTAPDVVYSHPNWFSAFASKRFLADLAPYTGRDRSLDLADFYPGVLAFLQHQGKLYGIPYYSGPAVVYCNKTLFQRLGAADPNEQERRGTWDWQAFLATARLTTAGEGSGRTLGYGSLDPTLSWIATWIWSGGGQLWDEALTRTLLDQQAALDALQFQADLNVKHHVVPTPVDAVQGGLKSGRIAMIHSGRFAVPDLKTISDFELGTAPVPKGPAGRRLRNGPNGWCIMQASESRDLAWEFQKFAASDAGQAPLLASSRPVPVRRALVNSEAYQRSLQPWESAAIYADASEHVQVFRAPAQLPEIQTAFTAAWTDVLAGQQSMRGAMAAFAPQANALMKSG